MVRLEEAATFINGYAFGPEEWATEGRPIIRIQNLTGSSSRWNYFAGSLPDRYLARDGDILVSWSASLGAFRWLGGEAWVNQHIFKVDQVSDTVDADYFYYALLNVIGSLKSKTHGSTMKHVIRKTFLNTEILLPDLDEQRAIAHVLHTVQRAKEQANQQSQALDELLRTLLHEVMTGKTSAKLFDVD